MSTPNEAFEEARDQFLKGLSPEEREQFIKLSSAEELLSDIAKLDHVRDDKKLLQRSMKKIKDLSDRLSPYFEIVNIVIQSHPEFAALAWGAIRLVLQLASNFSLFFEKLALTLGRLAQELPQYEQLAELCRDPDYCLSLSSGVRPSLIKVYSDLLEFFQSVVRIFTRKDGTIRSAPIVVSSLFWRPFDARFEELIARIKFHRQMIMDEVSLHHFRETLLLTKAANSKSSEIAKAEEHCKIVEGRLQEFANLVAAKTTEIVRETREEFESMKRDQAYREILKWLRPPEFVNDYEKAINTKENGTAEWLFGTNKFEEWREERLSSNTLPDRKLFGAELLWIQGNPGYGKTILASSTVEELRDTSMMNVYYYFFRADDPRLNNEIAAYQAILAQILHAYRQDQDLIDKFAFAMNKKSDGQLVASVNGLKELILLCTSHIAPYILVLDGIDECLDNADLIQRMMQMTATLKVKAILFSRPNVKSLLKVVPRSQWLLVGKSTFDDVALFLSRRLDTLIGDWLFPVTLNKAELLHRLTIGADGMFLWARLMMDYLSSPALTSDQRVQTIMNVYLPEGLSDIYARISKLICEGHPAERRLAQWVITWLLYSRRPLTVTELKETLKVMDTETSNNTADIPNFEEAVLLTCGSLVEPGSTVDVRYPTPAASFRLVHLSVKEYFASDNNNMVQRGGFADVSINPPSNLLSKSRIGYHLDILRSCLQYHVFCVPAQLLQTDLGPAEVSPNQQDVDLRFPLCHYTSLLWIEHLDEAVVGLSNMPPGGIKKTEDAADYHRTLKILSSFLSNKSALMSWIEVTYVFWRRDPEDLFHRWNVCAATWTSKVGLMDPEIQRLCGDVAELTEYLCKLHHEWGDRLLDHPGCIWEEVTAFTPSRFVQEDSATDIHHLLTDGDPPGPCASSRYLWKISEPSADGLSVGVLSIWPSSEFAECIKLRDGYYSAKIASTSSGWWARYELWSTRDLETPLVDISFPLKQGEVLLQLWQSMWLEAGSFKAQFPGAISPNTSHFAILRTVYFLETDPGNSSVSLRHCILPFQPRDSLCRFWPSDLSKSGGLRSTPGSWPGEVPKAWNWSPNRVLYRYWTAFSSDGRFIFFIDNALDGSIANLAMFEINLPSGLRLTVRSQTVSDAWGRSPVREVATAFHRDKPLLALSDGQSVFLWPFHDHASPLWDCSITLSFPGKINFSSCGTHIIVQEGCSSWPVIRTVPAFLLQDLPPLPPLAAPGRPDQAPEPGYSTTRQAEPQNQITARAAAPTGMVSGSWMTTTANGAIGIDPVHDSSQVSLRIWQQEGRGLVQEREVQLTKLPTWPGMNRANISVQLPGTSSDSIKVIFNKSARTWSDLSEPVDAVFPLVVSRDPRSLKRSSPSYLTLPDGRRRAISAGSGGDSVGSGAKRMRKEA